MGSHRGEQRLAFQPRTRGVLLCPQRRVGRGLDLTRTQRTQGRGPCAGVVAGTPCLPDSVPEVSLRVDKSPGGKRQKEYVNRRPRGCEQVSYGAACRRRASVLVSLSPSKELRFEKGGPEETPSPGPAAGHRRNRRPLSVQALLISSRTWVAMNRYTCIQRGGVLLPGRIGD